MAQEIRHHRTLEIASDLSASIAQSSPESTASSSSRLNARAQEFVPRASPSPPLPSPVMIHQAAAVAMSPAMHAFHSSVVAPASPTAAAAYYAVAPGSSVDFYGGAEHEVGRVGGGGDPDGLSDDATQKIAKQVEYYFSDINLATTEHLMRFITRDPEGFVPISVIAAFKKIKALIHSNSQLAMALRTSSKLLVSDDGKKVRRQQPLTEADIEELQLRIVVAENLPEDHCYQNLMKIFSAVGSVKTIRTCYPQAPNGTTPANASGRSKLDILFGNTLHAFVEYETVEDAEKAIMELNDKNWRNGLKLRSLNKCLSKHGQSRGKKGLDGEVVGDDDVSASDHPVEKPAEDPHQLPEASHEHIGEDISNDKDAPKRGGRGQGRGRGGRARGRGHHPSNSRGSGHTVGTPTTSHVMHADHPTAHKQPPGPRMPDGTKGFTLGRGKPSTSTSSV